MHVCVSEMYIKYSFIYIFSMYLRRKNLNEHNKMPLRNIPGILLRYVLALDNMFWLRAFLSTQAGSRTPQVALCKQQGRWRVCGEDIRRHHGGINGHWNEEFQSGVPGQPSRSQFTVPGCDIRTSCCPTLLHIYICSYPRPVFSRRPPCWECRCRTSSTKQNKFMTVWHVCSRI